MPFSKGDANINRAGRPIGSRNFETLYREGLIKLAELEGITPEDLEDEIIQTAVKAAKKGDYRFYKDTLDRLHGKAQDKLDVTTKGEHIFSNEQLATIFKRRGSSGDTGSQE